MAFTEREKKMFEAGFFAKKLFNETTVSGGSGSMDATKPDIMICEEIVPKSGRIRGAWTPYVEKIKTDGTKVKGYFVKPSYLTNLMRSLITAQNVNVNMSDYIAVNSNLYCYGVEFVMNGVRIQIYITFKSKKTCTDGEYLDIEECCYQGQCTVGVSAPDFHYGYYWDSTQAHNESTTGRGNPGNQERLYFDYKYFEGYSPDIIMFDSFQVMPIDEDTYYLKQYNDNRYHIKGKMDRATAKLTAGFNPIALNNLFYGFMCNAYPSSVFNDSTGVKMAKPYLLYGTEKYYPKPIGQLIISMNKEFMKVKDLISGTIYIIKRVDYTFTILQKIEGGN